MSGPTPEHEELRTWGGAYVLGALEPSERARFARHLTGCEGCRAEIAAFAPIPGLLSGLAASAAETSDPAGTGLLPPPAPDAVMEGAIRRAHQEQRRDRRRLRRWQVLAVAAALAAVVAVISRPSPASVPTATGEVAGSATTLEAPPTTGPTGTAPTVVSTAVAPAALTFAIRPAEGGTESGTIRLESRRWGTALFVEATGLPQRGAYTLWAVGADGRREPAATWGPTESGRTTCAGATSIMTGQLARIEIGDGEDVIATAEA